MKRGRKTKMLSAILLLLCPCKMAATEVGDSIDTYQNQTVSTSVTVHSQGILSVQSVTVTSSGNLKLSADSLIHVTGPFTVNVGGTLELHGGREHFVRYTYDAAGNRTGRNREY